MRTEIKLILILITFYFTFLSHNLEATGRSEVFLIVFHLSLLKSNTATCSIYISCDRCILLPSQQSPSSDRLYIQAMADAIGIMVDQRNVDSNERQAPPKKVWAQKVAIAFMKKTRGVPTQVAKIYSIFTFDSPTDLDLIWKIPLFLVLWVVIVPLYLISYKWKRVFIASCIAISLDPLFLYIPIIDEANQCLGTDKTLRNIILVFRSYIDIVFIFQIILLISDQMEDPTSDDDINVSESQSQETSCWPLKSFGAAIAQKIPWLSTSIVITCLAILPIPQVAILVVFFRMNGTNLFRIRSLINFALFFQFVVRIFQMYSSSKKVEKFANWVYGSFYFFLYILASHVFAAFWYFFSIQQVTSCWHQACRNSGVCLHNYNCGGSTPNSKLLNGLCSISSPNATDFNFGMYTNILQSGNTGSISFPQKFFYYFWWGLKNLSNFGTNLETSSNVWENCFAITICITGLLLFLYLIGNVQLYIQMYMQRKAEKIEKKKIEEAKIEEVNHEFMENWMTRHGLQDYIKEFRRHIAKVKAWELSNKHIDTKFMIDSIGETPIDLIAGIFSKQNPFEIISANALRKIPGLENIQIEHLVNKCYYRVNKHKGSCIARAGEPIEAMWLIIDGVIECKDAETTAARASSPIMSLQTHDYFGVELLRWAILNYGRAYQTDPRPVSPLTLTCQTDVIAFIVFCDDLISTLHEMSMVDDIEKLKAWALGYNHAAAVDLRLWKQEDILDWLSRNGVPPHLKLDITNSINKDPLVENNINAEVDVEFLFSVLPEKITKSLRCHLGVNSLTKVPMLKSMHRYVLEIICEHLKPVIYKDESYIVREGEVLGFMIFILQGTVILTGTNRSNATTTTSSEITESSDELKKGDFYGEQLLMRWASPYNVSFSDHPVISTVSAKCGTKVEALILKAEDLRSAVAQCGSRWNLNDCSSESKQLVGHGTDSVIDTSPSAARMTSTSNEQTLQPHQGHDMILQQMVLIRETMFRRFDDVVGRLDDQGQRLDEMAAFLATLGYNGTSPPPAT